MENRWSDDRSHRDEDRNRFGAERQGRSAEAQQRFREPGSQFGQSVGPQDYGWEDTEYRGRAHDRGAPYRGDLDRNDLGSDHRSREYGDDDYRSGFRRGYATDHERDYQYRGGFGGPGGFQGQGRGGDYGRTDSGDWGARPVHRNPSFAGDRAPARDDRRWDHHPRDRGAEERSWWDRTTDEVASWMGNEDAEYRRQMDRRNSHYGRGPSGYTRSDSRIAEDVNDRLTDDWRVDATDIAVTVSNAEVTLNGTVHSRDEKRRAEDVAEAVSGVKHVQNNLRVKQAVAGGSEAARPAGANVAGSTGASLRTDKPIH